MSKRGYKLEAEVESRLLELAYQNRDMPFDERTFRVANSGAMRSCKGDVRTKIPGLKRQFVIECKQWTESNKIGLVHHLRPKLLEKIEDEALSDKRLPAYVFQFKGKGSKVIRKIKQKIKGTTETKEVVKELISGRHSWLKDEIPFRVIVVLRFLDYKDLELDSMPISPIFIERMKLDLTVTSRNTSFYLLKLKDFVDMSKQWENENIGLQCGEWIAFPFMYFEDILKRYVRKEING